MNLDVQSVQCAAIEFVYERIGIILNECGCPGKYSLNFIII